MFEKPGAVDNGVQVNLAQTFRIEAAGETNVGRKRGHNEDNFAILAEFGLFIVADGMGGHACGEVASKIAIDTMQEFFKDTADDPEKTWPYKLDRTKGYEENRLIMGIKLANLRIYDTAVATYAAAALKSPTLVSARKRRPSFLRNLWPPSATRNALD